MPTKLQRVTWGLICFQLFYWTLVPWLAHHAPPLDATEMYGWSLSWEWGFYKHPPMPTWIVALVQAIIGKNMFSLFLCASLAIAATYYAVAWLSAKFLEEKEAIVALFLYALTIYCHLWSSDFNHNQIQMPFWAFSLVFLYLTLQQGGLRNAFILGLLMGLNALSKYTAAFIVPCALLLILFSKPWQKQFTWQTIGMATLGFLLVFSPHLLWLTEHQFLPFQYVSQRFEELDQSRSNFISLIDYIGNTLLAHLILLLMVLFGRWKYPAQMTQETVWHSLKNTQFLWWLGLGPFLLSCLIGLWIPLYYRWVTPMLPMLTIVAVYFLKGRLAHLYQRKFFIGFIVLQIIFGVVYLGKATFSKNSARGNYPAPEVTMKIQDHWQSKYPKAPLRIIAGGEWEAGFVSLFSADKGFVFTQADYVLSPWVTSKMVQDCGMVMLAPSAQELERFAGAQVQEPIVIAARPNYGEVRMPWAILAPQGECTY